MSALGRNTGGVSGTSAVGGNTGGGSAVGGNTAGGETAWGKDGEPSLLEAPRVRSWRVAQLVEIMQRRYLLRRVALELFSIGGRYNPNHQPHKIQRQSYTICSNAQLVEIMQRRYLLRRVTLELFMTGGRPVSTTNHMEYEAIRNIDGASQPPIT